MTRRFYYEDSHLKECDATVVSCEKTDAGYDIELDGTVLFENAGGQPCDTGMIGSIPVLGVDEVDGRILHHTEQPIKPGTSCHVALDWERRFDFMQQHTGEHLLSYAVYKLFGACNVGFHLSADYTTIDMDSPLSEEQLEEAERLANRFVSANTSVTCRMFESEEALKKSGTVLRKQAEGLKAPIRIVSIEGADCCTCCAPHCALTGEVGPVLITEAIAYKGGTRITFLCGDRAVKRAQEMRAVLRSAAKSFSTSWESVPDAVVKLQEDCKKLRHSEHALTERVNDSLAKELVSQAEKAGKTNLILAKVDNINPGSLKSLAQKTLSGPNTLTILFSVSDDRVSYILAASDEKTADISELCKTVNMLFSGKGGGRGTLAQGMSQRTECLDESLSQLRNYLLKTL